MEKEECSDSNTAVADSKSLLANMEDQKKLLRLKRRWLMGLPISESEKKSLFSQTCLLESFVREDDLFPGNVRRLIEQIRGAPKAAEVVSEYYKSPQLANIRRLLERNPEALTIKGLNLVAQSLAGGEFSRSLSTRKQMKVVIKEELSKIQRRDHSKLQAELSHVLDDPENINFREIYLPPPSPPSSSCIASAVVAILDSLECLPTESLLAMHRTLKGKPPTVPRMQHARYGWSREKLIHIIREMSSELFPSESFFDYDDDDDDDNEGDELLVLPSPLAKALAIAGLSFKYMVGLESATSHALTNFVQFPKETLAVQEEIGKAIAMIKSTKVRVPELRSLQRLLDPQADDVPNGNLRTLLKKVLMKYLFECGGELRVSESLTEALSIINRSSRGAPGAFISKEEIEDEVERVLDLSACMKQLVWDLLPGSDRLDQDYYDAYIEELEESEEEEDDSFEECNIGCGYKDDKEEHVADNMAHETTSTVLSQEFTTHLSSDTPSRKSHWIAEGAASDEAGPETSYSVAGENLYLGIQQASDEASMAAYNVIGRIIEGLAENEGLELDLSDRLYLRGNRPPAQENRGKGEKQAYPDGKEDANCTVFLRAFKEMLPKSGMDKLKDFMTYL